jgi:hypothetical protein
MQKEVVDAGEEVMEDEPKTSLCYLCQQVDLSVGTCCTI